MAKQTIDGITADFQQGGWYSGRQYWNGTLSAPGAINSQSNQVGAGQAVSPEVIKQTNPNNVSYIQSQQGGQSSAPTSKEAVTPYLNDYQSSLYNASSAPETRIPTMEELKTTLAPTNELPKLLNRAEDFSKLRTEYGVADLETSLSNLKKQEQDETAAFRTQKGLEEGKPVAMGVIAGRISEEERVAQERVDAIVRQKAVVVDELNTKYNVINQLMTFKGLDYNDAVTRYEDEYNRNLKLYDVILGQQKEARSEREYAQTSARANLQIYVNSAINGNIDYNSLGADQKLMINKLEVQSGLPVGLISSIKKDPKADIVFTTSNEGVTQIGMRNADGTISVQSYGTRTAGGGTVAERQATQKKADFSEMNQILALMGGTDKVVSGSQWSTARSDWAQQGYDVKDFDGAFAKFTNPDWDTYAGLE
jgi:hypothetical protein